MACGLEAHLTLAGLGKFRMARCGSSVARDSSNDLEARWLLGFEPASWRSHDVHFDHLSHLTFMAYIPFSWDICTIDGPDKTIVQRGESGMPNLDIHDMNPKRTRNIKCTTKAIEIEEWKNHNPDPHVQYNSLCTIQDQSLSMIPTVAIFVLIWKPNLSVQSSRMKHAYVHNVKTPLAYTYSCWYDHLIRNYLFTQNHFGTTWALGSLKIHSQLCTLPMAAKLHYFYATFPCYLPYKANFLHWGSSLGCYFHKQKSRRQCMALRYPHFYQCNLVYDPCTPL
ncbi:hypothetical protein VNO77_03398 [Canavalia gladiata]|uniref:Uncharacterized protein n=1 Tax=Canavalia gladiata TaxID=3824 RepID=A0AAN9MUM9_CANGL